VPEPAAAPAFDAVIVVTPAADGVVGGLTCFQRLAFAMARAGCGRVLCLGDRPRSAAHRLPTVAWTWTDAPDAWLAGCRAPLLVATTDAVTDAATIVDLLRAPGPATLVAASAAPLWRTDAATLAATFAAGGLRGAGAPPAEPAPWHPPPTALLCRAGDPDARAAAERCLYVRLGRAGDGWFTRLVDRRLSRVVTRLLLPTGISPNQVTIGSIAIGIAGGCCFALGTPGAAAIGALLFLASTIIDGCDGEIARLTFRESVFGARLDVLGDNVVHLFLFGGIAAGLYRRSGDPLVAWLGVVLVLGVLLAMATVYWCVVRQAPNASQRALFEAFASREFAYLLVVLTLIGRLDWFLWMSAIGTYVFAGGLLALGRRTLVQ
jgi:phosphatidylglycerophosphate synthase